MITTSRKDILWNYVGTIMSMVNGFLLLPFLLVFLSGDTLGLWYVFVSVGNLTLLFEFGFNPTFARNVLYCISGARRLTKTGCDYSSVKPGIDFHLLNTLLSASKFIYRIIALVALVGVGVIGTAYVYMITPALGGYDHWVAWVIFLFAIVLNLYFFYTLTFLRGLGDIVSENKAKTFSKLVQLLSTVVFLCLGLGIVGAALGYLLSGVTLRVFASFFIRRHGEIICGLTVDSKKVLKQEIKEIVAVVLNVSWRDGVVQLTCYGSTQAMTIICSLFFSLTVTGTFSIMIQLCTALYQFSSAYIKSFYPMYQSSFINSDTVTMRRILCNGMFVYYLLYLIAYVFVDLLVLPLIPWFRPDFSVDYLLFSVTALYFFLWNQHSIFCNLIVCTNRIPYLSGYVIAFFLGVLFSFLACKVGSFGVSGLVAGQILSQALFNNWRWPLFVLSELQIGYLAMLKQGLLWFRLNLHKLVK